MFDLFTEEIEVQIKNGISNLYWYKDDLKKAWLRSGVDFKFCDSIFSRKNNGIKLTKRELMDHLYLEIRTFDFNRRLEISRNFVRLLIEHKNFVPQDPKHRIEIAERCALKLKEIINNQQKEKEEKEQLRIKAQMDREKNGQCQLATLRGKFLECYKLEGQKRGYAFEKIFPELMRINEIIVDESFKIVGEQIDGAIKFDGHHYLVELKWTNEKIDQKNIASLYLKVEGKLEARGIFIAMNGYSNEVIQSLPKGKNLKVLLLDGIHITNVISGLYTFKELMEYAISQASLKGEIYCLHDLHR
ncbi:restriction endonuclease type iv mrr [Lucifera butyrica]|uniref:Restriction endonuclease type iv mrr n=1 Tax=Lucifera butyrica TaxID=1351585 RepID=A0A498R3G6_9FIRM|nr:restriction endonuclease [Lucifera butyrica]VBB05705.1 restriction endonuclease type iv mrr [Lucifera butyrica]